MEWAAMEWAATEWAATELAARDGNRTRLERGDALHTRFEVGAGHQPRKPRRAGF